MLVNAEMVRRPCHARTPLADFFRILLGFMRVTEKQRHSSPGSIREQAIDWCLRLESPDATANDRQCFEAWRDENPRHRREYEEAVQLWSDMDHVKALWAEARRQAAQQGAVAGGDQTSVSPRPSLFDRQAWAPAMGVVAAICALTLWWAWKPTAPVQHYQTVKGEQHTFHLDDGSTVVMNTDSALSVQLSTRERMVTLQQGEALFMVSHDAERPFTVLARNGRIRDIGTQFLIHTFSEHVEVSVLEGMVDVDIPDANAFHSSTGELQRLVKGDQVQFTSAGHLSSVHAFDSAMALAWTNRFLVFENAPLEEVLKEWARYRTEELRLLDSNLRSLPVNGKFRIDHLESFLQALEDGLSIKARRIDGGLVILESQSRS